eukprot:TRINITY_DN64136_c0_g1_i1.p1 TRINITY_DN64136_c0_g1~~TRINITY_DN64136_c0_g1_i1.p1  ORF type:complete len:392 (-),score=55.03 TRINITY_DN64136_c0_g1_i1:138-1313(-)
MQVGSFDGLPYKEYTITEFIKAKLAISTEGVFFMDERVEYGGIGVIPFMFNKIVPLALKYPGDSPAAMRIPINADGSPKGYSTMLWEMKASLEAGGAHVYMGRGFRVENVMRNNNKNYKYAFKLANGKKAFVDFAILNMGKPGLERLGDSFVTREASSTFQSTLQQMVVWKSVKCYLFYDNAFWRAPQGMPLARGYYVTDAVNYNFRFHDGNTKCDVNGLNCKGAFLASYQLEQTSYSNWYWTKQGVDSQIRDNIYDGLRVITRNSKKRWVKTMDQLHEGVMEALGETASRAGFDLNTVSPPSGALCGTWDDLAWQYEAQDAGNFDRQSISQPVLGEDVFVVNELYSWPQGWAEASFLSVENMLRKRFNTQRPPHIPEMYWEYLRMINRLA